MCHDIILAQKTLLIGSTLCSSSLKANPRTAIHGNDDGKLPIQNFISLEYCVIFHVVIANGLKKLKPEAKSSFRLKNDP